jgi:hypothetical protein
VRGRWYGFDRVTLAHLHQPLGMPSIIPGRDPDAPIWISVATAEGEN